MKEREYLPDKLAFCVLGIKIGISYSEVFLLPLHCKFCQTIFFSCLWDFCNRLMAGRFPVIFLYLRAAEIIKFYKIFNNK